MVRWRQRRLMLESDNLSDSRLRQALHYPPNVYIGKIEIDDAIHEEPFNFSHSFIVPSSSTIDDDNVVYVFVFFSLSFISQFE